MVLLGTFSNSCTRKLLCKAEIPDGGRESCCDGTVHLDHLRGMRDIANAQTLSPFIPVLRSLQIVFSGSLQQDGSSYTDGFSVMDDVHRDTWPTVAIC
jgi:hypothetical protein